MCMCTYVCACVYVYIIDGLSPLVGYVRMKICILPLLQLVNGELPWVGLEVTTLQVQGNPLALKISSKWCSSFDFVDAHRYNALSPLWQYIL